MQHSLDSTDYDGTHFELDDSFTNRFYPHWVIQYWWTDILCPSEWRDADRQYYDGDANLHGEVGGMNFRAVHLYPEDLKIQLIRLRQRFPDVQFRMVMRVKAEKVIDI